MMKPQIPHNEQERIDALNSYDLKDYFNSDELQSLVELAAEVCNTPISLITVIDEDTQWIKLNVGLDVPYTSRDVSFCGHAINTPGQIFQVPDATIDDRFKDNPLVQGDPNIVFYAGMPLVTEGGLALGTLCVIDREPRELNKIQHRLLHVLSQQVMRMFELRKTMKELKDKDQALETAVESLNEYTSMVAHDLKTSFRSIEVSTEILQNITANLGDANIAQHLSNIQTETNESMEFTNGILRYAQSVNTFNDDFEKINLKSLVEKVCSKLNIPENYKIDIDPTLPIVNSSYMAMQHIFENIIQNAVKYMDKAKPELKVTYALDNGIHILGFSDNGPGIPNKYLNTIFQRFTRADQQDNMQGSGIGLSIVGKLVAMLEGTITVDSKVGAGTQFTLRFRKNIAQQSKLNKAVS